MSNPKALPLRSGTSQAIISASSPLSPNHNHKFRRYKSQNLGNGKQIQKRDLLINVGNATSPFNSATKPQAKGSDLFSNGLDDFHHTKRPSMSTTRNEDASTRAGTLTCLSRNNLKSSQAPYSLTSLNSENYTPSLCTKDMNITIRRSDDNEVQVNTNQRANLNGTIIIAGGGFGGDNEVRQASVSLVTESALEALELMGEDNLTQRSNRKEEETKKQNFTIRKEEKVLAVTRSGKKKKKVLERTKSRKTKRENSESKDSIVKNTNRKKEKSVIEYKSNEKNKSVLKKTNTDENINATQPEQEEKVIREDAKDQNIQINLLTQHITSYQNNIDEIAKTESILEIKTLRANTLENINRGQEFAEMRRIHNASQGGLQERLNIEKKLELKNERGYETFEKRNKYRTNESCSIELARDRSNNQPEDKLHYSSDVSKLMQITRRPTLRRMKSELQTCQNVLDRDQSQNLAVVKEQTDRVPQAPKKEMLITDELHTERLALKEIQAGEQSSQKEAEKMESGKKTRNDERKKVQKKEDKEDLKKSANKRDTQDIWRQNIWDDPQEKPDPKFELFKQTGNNFFELNLENKFLQKYGFLRTFEDNAMSTEEQERIYTENLFDGCNTPENLRTETFSRKIMKTLPTEYSSKESKSEKVLKADPSTMMVRYYDELNPVVIQPKFMASTGSMCVTELWGNKNKQDFYKTMRKPFQSNTIFSLNPQPGVYRPEKPSHNVDPNYKKLLSERIDKENETAGAKSPTMKDNFAFRSSRRARHTRAFVLQGTADSQAAKKVPYNRGYSSRDGA